MIQAFLAKYGIRLAGLGAAVALIAVSALYAFSLVENRHLTKVNTRLETSINDPISGYVAKLAQARTNTAQLTTAISDQRRSFERKAAADAANLADTRRRLDVAQAETALAKHAAARLLAKPPVGDTLEKQILDIDARILETL